LKLKFDELLSSFGFQFNLRHYNEVAVDAEQIAWFVKTVEEHPFEAGAYTLPLFGLP
jgi:hypothetical protein